MRSTRDIRICNVCGRLLDIGESCNCEQPIRGAPRDGLRAKCPLFKCRSCYRLQYYIVGECGKARFTNSDQRNEHYRRCCCDAWRACEIYKRHDEGSDRK